MIKIIRDTLMKNGVFSLKRVSAFVAFWIAQLYVVAVHVFGWTVMEFVYDWLMGWSMFAITGTVVDKKFLNKANIFKTSAGTVQKETIEKTTSIKKIDDNPGTPNDEIG